MPSSTDEEKKPQNQAVDPHGQSAKLVDEIRERADKESLAQREPNELGQQPMHHEKTPAKALTPQELRERKRE